ncbi:hypothetical protein JW905_06710 [bacterium]|nr:hypothetical protein [candidate division CSSED10-310 bacterium]
MKNRVLVLLLAGALLGGATVLVLNKNYRFSNNLRSNSDYYPAVVAGKTTDTPEPGKDAGADQELIQDLLDQP